MPRTTVKEINDRVSEINNKIDNINRRIDVNAENNIKAENLASDLKYMGTVNERMQKDIATLQTNFSQYEKPLFAKIKDSWPIVMAIILPIASVIMFFVYYYYSNPGGKDDPFADLIFKIWESRPVETEQLVRAHIESAFQDDEFTRAIASRHEKSISEGLRKGLSSYVMSSHGGNFKLSSINPFHRIPFYGVQGSRINLACNMTALNVKEEILPHDSNTKVSIAFNNESDPIALLELKSVAREGAYVLREVAVPSENRASPIYRVPGRPEFHWIRFQLDTENSKLSVDTQCLILVIGASEYHSLPKRTSTQY